LTVVSTSFRHFLLTIFTSTFKMPSTLKAAVLASVLPQCLALAIGSFGDDVAAPAVAMPEDLESDVYWGDKHNRLRYTPETFNGEVELMIRDLGMTDS